MKNKFLKFIMVFTLLFGVGATVLTAGSQESYAIHASAHASHASHASSHSSSHSFSHSSSRGFSGSRSTSRSAFGRSSSRSGFHSNSRSSSRSGSRSYSSKSPNGRAKSATRSGSSHGGYSKSSPNGRIKSGSSFGKSKAYSSMSPNVRNRAFETPKFNVKKPSKSVLNSRQNSHLNKNYSIINRGYGRSYNAYFLNPYDPFYHHHHYYFDDWIFHDTYTTQQQQILMQQGISPDSVKKPAVTTYWVKVKDKKTDDEPKMINVTKDQFNMIKSGQNIRVSKGIIYVDGKEIK